MVRLLSLGWVALAVHQDSPGKIVLDFGGGVKMEFVRIKAGRFLMGSESGDKDEKPAHEVTISKDFWIQTTETTQAQWEAVMEENPSCFKGADLPVDSVSWEDCREFLKRLNEKGNGQLKGKTAGLPTEAQWEYACRANGRGKWCFGDDEKKLVDYAWYGDNAEQKTHPVGRKKANAWGLFDMHGNVLEWCEDWYGEYPSEAVTDPTGSATGDTRTLRGGSWWNYVNSSMGSACRSENRPRNRNDTVGVRPVLR